TRQAAPIPDDLPRGYHDRRRSAHMAEPFIQVHDLVKTFDTPAGPLNVLRGISLEIPKGTFATIVGPSGSGKTTFLNMLTAVDAPASGEIIVGGVPVTQVPQR